MNTDILKKIFQSQFDYTLYCNEIIHKLFGCNDISTRPELLGTTAEGDKSYYIGRHTDTEGRELGFFYTKVAPGSDVRRKRVGLRKLVSPYLKYDVDAAIAVFADDSHWRLSYICDMKDGITAAKRFSYILGEAQGQYKTPLERLEKIYNKGGWYVLNDLRDAFSVEALSKEFFDMYHSYYDRIVAELARQGKSGAMYHDYVKKMMGRIVFLHFLQKKGWLNGNPYFLRDMFFLSPHQKDFLDQVLEPLFFGIFNTEQNKRAALFKERQWDAELLKQWQALPYLNGGLFEEDEIDRMNITLPAKLFEDLFKDLALYNFTVDENDPDDAEIGVDPEMLGKIFESLLEDNKSKGAFYTPKEIVRYMCKESLIAHLSSKLPDVADSVVRTFVESHEMQPELEDYRQQLSAALREIKICDPAIGSGAFPMGLLNELWRCREALEPTEHRVVLKKEIIENNIYGVDIEKGAIDIARLRFWLSIVVDSEKPEALPNFDYKFMQGNSLIESFDGVDLSWMMSNESQLGRVSKGRSVVGTNQYGIEFASDDTKRNLQMQLKNYFSITDHHKKTEMRRSINDSVKNYIRQMGVTPSAEYHLASLDPSANQEFFLWHTWFKDIFDEGGFDIVIGNPPYGAKVSKEDKDYYKKAYWAANSYSKQNLKGSTDTFVVFTNLGHSLLDNGGELAFIVPMSIGSSDALTSLQYMLEKDCKTIRISSYSNRPKQIFDDACVRTSIFMFSKTGTPNAHVFTTKLNRRTKDRTIKNIIDELQYVDSKELKIYGRYPKIGSKMELQVLSKLFNTGMKMKDYYDPDGKNIYYRAAGGRYFNVVTNYPTYSSAEKSFSCLYNNIMGLIMSSSVFYFYQQVYTDGLNIKKSEIDNIPVPNISKLGASVIEDLTNLYSNYLEDIEKNALVHQTSETSTHHIESFKEYKIIKSMNLIREIDDRVCKLYGLDTEETTFIKNYEIAYRMAGEK